MTATPIPRTRHHDALRRPRRFRRSATVRRAGRRSTPTWSPRTQRAQWWEFFAQQAPRGAAGLRRHAAGRGVGADRRRPASTRPTRPWPTARWRPSASGLIHGRMSPAEKDAVMADFRRGEIQVLVCTSVVEVGVDVPNATLMTIEGGRAVRPGPVAPASRPDQPRRASRLLRRVRRSADRRGQRAPRGLRLDHRRLPRWPRSISPCAGRASCSARGSTACRRFALPTWCATPRCSKRPAATPSSWSTSDPGLAQPDHARLRQMVPTRYGQALELGDVG